MRNFILKIYTQFYHLLLFFRRSYLVGIFFAVIFILIFGNQAFTTDYYVDSEVIINIPKTNYNWLSIGRFGLVFLRHLLGTSWHNPYYTGILFLFFLWLTAMTFYYVLSKLFPKTSSCIVVFAVAIFLTYPTFFEQYYFQFQSAEITFCLWLTAISTGMLYLFLHTRAYMWFVLPIPIYIITFATYQSFIPLTLCTYAAVLLVFTYKEFLNKQSPARNNLLTFLLVGLQFLLAFGIMQAINKFCFPTETYLSDQIIWTNEYSHLHNLFDILLLCLSTFIGSGFFNTSLFMVSFFISFALLVRKLPKGFCNKLQIIFLYLAIGIAPYLLFFILGKNTAIRTQFTMPFSCIIFLLMAYEFAAVDFHFLKSRKYIVPLLMLLPLSIQFGMYHKAYTIKSIIQKNDKEIAIELLDVMYTSWAIKDSCPVIFWGGMQTPTPYDDFISEIPAYSFLSVYNLEYQMEPYSFFSSNRILGYLESMGHKFIYPTSKSRSHSEYIIQIENLPSYPNDGFLHNSPNGVTIRLSPN